MRQSGYNPYSIVLEIIVPTHNGALLLHCGALLHYFGASAA